MISTLFCKITLLPFLRFRALSWNRLEPWSKMIICLADGIFLCPNLDLRMDDASLLYSCSKITRNPNSNCRAFPNQECRQNGQTNSLSSRQCHQLQTTLLTPNISANSTSATIAFPPKATFNNRNENLIIAKLNDTYS